MKIFRLIFIAVLSVAVSCVNKGNIEIPEVNIWKPQVPDQPSEDVEFYKGVTMTFASYLEETGGKSYMEDGRKKDPYISVKDHGGNIVRLSLEPEGYPRTAGMDAVSAPDVDWQEMHRVKKDMLRAKNAELDVFLTLKPEKSIARCWLNEDGSVPSREVLGKKLYDWIYASLEELDGQGTLPAIVSVGNEVNAWFMVPESYMESGREKYDYQGNVYFLSQGLKAVKDFSKAKNVEIMTACHIFSPDAIQWWCREHKGITNCDMLAISWYLGYPGHSMDSWTDYSSIVKWLKTNCKWDFFVLETSYPYTLENADNQTNIYYADQDWATGSTSPAKQRTFLSDMAGKLRDAGALGMITWGNESLPTDCYIYANDDWGKGSSWENNSYWDSSCNLHEGIDWMSDL